MTKKILISIFAVMFSIVAVGQQQPENPGFELWEDVGLNTDEPVDWSSIKTSNNSTANLFAPYVWDQSTDTHSGTYSVRLENGSVLGIVAAGTVTNGRIHANVNPPEGWAYTDTGDDRWNTPFTSKPDSIVVWAKHDPAGADIAQVKALLHTGSAQIPDPNQTNYIAETLIEIPDATLTWTRFSTPFTYYNSNIPEYILLVCSAADDVVATVGTEAWFDDLELIYNPLLFDLKVFLEGAYISSNIMQTDLNPNFLPLSQPFNMAPWNYSGTESVVAIPNSHVVDWVMIELRDAPNAAAATSSTIIGRQAGFLLDNGLIRGLEGNNKIRFDNLFNYDINDNLYVVIHHRNHLSVMSADALIKADGEFAYDFTDDVAKTYGGAAGCNLLSTGPDVWGMIGGDGDANGTVNEIDKTSFWSILTGKSGYLSGDYNMDGQTNNQDKNEVWLDNNTKASQVPN